MAHNFKHASLANILDILASGAIPETTQILVKQLHTSTAELLSQMGFLPTDVFLQYDYNSESGYGYVNKPQIGAGVGPCSGKIALATPSYQCSLAQATDGLSNMDIAFSNDRMTLITNDQGPIDIWYRYPKETATDSKVPIKKLLASPEILSPISGIRVSEIPDNAVHLQDTLYHVPSKGYTYPIVDLRAQFAKYTEIPDGDYSVLEIARSQGKKADGTKFIANTIVIKGDRGYYKVSAGRVKSVINIMLGDSFGNSSGSNGEYFGVVTFEDGSMARYRPSPYVQTIMLNSLVA